MNIQGSKNSRFFGQSAVNSDRENSEALRAKSLVEYVSGVIDGDGNFDIRNIRSSSGLVYRKLKSIRIKMQNRDIRVLAKVKDFLRCGRLNSNKSLVTYQISTEQEMIRVVRLLNGHIRLKTVNFKEACQLFGIEYIEANYTIESNSKYLCGLIDTDGSIGYNYQNNNICLSLELKDNEQSRRLNLDHAIPEFKPKTYFLQKRNQSAGKTFYSTRFIWQNSNNTIWLYEYACKNRLFSDFKFYRFMQIKRFVEIKHFKNAKKDSDEHLVYSKWVIDFMSHLNPKFQRVTYYKKLSFPQQDSKDYEKVQ